MPIEKCINLNNIVLNRVTILKWITKYNKIDLIADLIGGVTLGVTMIPQAIAYASLAGVPPEYGLYTAFMGSIIYVFFGTIKEVSIGPTSLLSILIFSYTDGLSLDHVILLCFLSGLIVFLMGVLKLGFLIDFISTPVTSAFTTATSIIILSSQIKGLLGINIDGKGLVELYKKIFQNLHQTKIPDFLLGLSATSFLLIIRYICQKKVSNKKWKKALWLLSNSRNGLIVAITSSIAYQMIQNGKRVPFILTGNIPAGLPPLSFPNTTTIHNNQTINLHEMILNLGSGTIVIPLVAVLQNIAIAKAFSNGVVDATQEMITLGLANMLGSFVQAIPASGAFTRSAVSNASGVRTPLAGFYAASIILMALGFLTPYFYYIPKATLSAVLIAAVIFMIDYKIVFKLYPKHKFDLVTYSTTLILCLSCGVETGLFVGIIISTGNLLVPWCRPKIILNVNSDKNGMNYIIVKLEMGFYFSAVNYVTEIIKNEPKSLPIILDFSNIKDVDFTAVEGIKTLIMNAKRKVLIYKPNESVQNKLQDALIHQKVIFYDFDSLDHEFEVMTSEENFLLK
ncbi:sodium-independent sulfate anion transporter-like [Onthophagus taurus]|uniref:sodium-independent sulfate anion transporter-like n=1 Tax=Onthophagus taurus TaxID=166361 RepID=UPI0039BE2A8F